MIKFLVVVFIIISGSTYYNFKEKIKEEFISSYETWNDNLSEEEQFNYYIDNDIKPASIPIGVGTTLRKEDVNNHLIKKDSNYKNWKSINEHYVKDIYGGNPVELYQENPKILKAKELANNTYNYIGCGPVAMLSQFMYLSTNAGYVSIADNLEDYSDNSLIDTPNFTRLAYEIFTNTSTIPSEGPLGQELGKDPNDGTFTFPSEIIDSSMEILENHQLALKKVEEYIDEEGKKREKTYYDNDSQIIVSGDTIPSLSTFEVKKNNIKKSIDKGMPVIWWTLSDVQEFADHYMNIFGYEYWEGTDDKGNKKTHLMFILRTNWNYNYDVYMDSDVLNAINGGFIFFEEVHPKTIIKPSNYGYDCQYYFDEKSKVVSPYIGVSFYTNYLRAGYVNRYDKTNTNIIDQQLTLSCKKENVKEAYIDYKFVLPVKYIYLEASLWSDFEYIDKYRDEILIQYKDKNDNYITQLDLFNDLNENLSTMIDYKTKVKCYFDEPITEFRIYLKAQNPSGNRNKGRLTIGNMMIVHN